MNGIDQRSAHKQSRQKRALNAPSMRAHVQSIGSCWSTASGCILRLDRSRKNRRMRRWRPFGWHRRASAHVWNCWHSQDLRRQRQIHALTLQHFSKSMLHGAPTLRHGARRIVDIGAPPRFVQSPSTCQPFRAALHVLRRQRSPPRKLSTTISAAAWCRCRQPSVPGSSAPARPWLAMPADPCSMAR
jgi:hypothetical protein